MTEEPPRFPGDSDRALDAALAQLRPIDLDPLPARAQLLAAQRRLAQGGRRLSILERFEPALLVAFSAIHVVWAIIRVFGQSWHIL